MLEEFEKRYLSDEPWDEHMEELFQWVLINVCHESQDEMDELISGIRKRGGIDPEPVTLSTTNSRIDNLEMTMNIILMGG